MTQGATQQEMTPPALPRPAPDCVISPDSGSKRGTCPTLSRITEHNRARDSVTNLFLRLCPTARETSEFSHSLARAGPQSSTLGTNARTVVRAERARDAGVSLVGARRGARGTKQSPPVLSNRSYEYVGIASLRSQSQIRHFHLEQVPNCQSIDRSREPHGRSLLHREHEEDMTMTAEKAEFLAPELLQEIRSRFWHVSLSLYHPGGNRSVPQSHGEHRTLRRPDRCAAPGYESRCWLTGATSSPHGNEATIIRAVLSRRRSCEKEKSAS